MELEAGPSRSMLVSKNASSSPSVTSNSWLALIAEMTRTSSSSKSRIIDVTGNVQDSRQAFKALVNKEQDEEVDEEADDDDDAEDFRICLPKGPRPSPSNALLTSSTKIHVLTKSRFNVSATAALARMPSRRVRPEPQQD